MAYSPLISVVLIFLDEETYLEEAIASVLAQTYRNWELLLVDDGSCDRSGEIAQRYAQQQPDKIRYLTHENAQNKGMSAARNLGLSQAQGEFVSFLDGDDVYLPEKLAQQLAQLQAFPEAAMVYGSLQYWHSWTGRPEDLDRDFVPDVGVPDKTLFSPPELLTRLVQEKIYIPGICSSLIRRDTLIRIGGSEDSFRTLFEDQVLYAKICLDSPVLVSRDYYERYRRNPDLDWPTLKPSMTAYKARAYQARYTYLSWLEQYVRDRKVTDPQLIQGLNQALWPYRHPLRHRWRQYRWQLKKKLKRLVG